MSEVERDTFKVRNRPNLSNLTKSLDELQGGEPENQTSTPASNDSKEAEKEKWVKPNVAKTLNSLINGGSEDYSRISGDNYVDFDELWIRPNQVRNHYSRQKIKGMVADFVSGRGQLQPMGVCSVPNPENPKQRYNIVYGNTRYKAWEIIYTDPAYAHLREDKAWVAKHRPKAVLVATPNEEERIIVQTRENVVRDELNAWDVCAAAARLVYIRKSEGKKGAQPTPVLRDDFSIESNLKRFATICNIIIDNELIGKEEEFIQAFSTYHISSPRPILTFFNVYKHGLNKGIYSNLLEYLEFADSKGLNDLILAQDEGRTVTDAKIHATLGLIFDDYIPTKDEAASHEILAERYERAHRKEQPVHVEAPTTQPVSVQQPVQVEVPATQSVSVQQPVQVEVPATQPVSVQQPVQVEVPATQPVSVQQPVQVEAPTTQPVSVQQPVHVEAPATQPVSVQQPVDVEAPTTQPVSVQQATQPVQTAAIRNTDISSEDETEDHSADQVGSTTPASPDSLYELMNSGSKTAIGKHFIDLIKNSDDMEVGLFFENLYARLGDDLIEEIATRFS